MTATLNAMMTKYNHVEIQRITRWEAKGVKVHRNPGTLVWEVHTDKEINQRHWFFFHKMAEVRQFLVTHGVLQEGQPLHKGEVQ